MSNIFTRQDIGVNPRRRNPGVGVRMTREVQEACDKINWGKVEEVLVTIKPWVRVDGTLNRSDGDDIYLLMFDNV